VGGTFLPSGTCWEKKKITVFCLRVETSPAGLAEFLRKREKRRNKGKRQGGVQGVMADREQKKKIGV